MAYFNHAFTKRFLANGPTITPATPSAQNPATQNGFILTSGVPSSYIATMGYQNLGAYQGYVGFVNPKTYTTTDDVKCPFMIVGSSMLRKDKIGPFHGGYTESNKSKVINPKYVSQVYGVASCIPQQTVVSVGNTPYTDDQAITAVLATVGANLLNGTFNDVALTGGSGNGATGNFVVQGGQVVSFTLVNEGTDYSNGDILTADLEGNNLAVTPSTVEITLAGQAAGCCFQFLCGETYYLRIDVKGSPALRYLNHNAYQTLDAYTGCCEGPTPTPVDSTLVFIKWAERLKENQYINPFIFPVVYDQAGGAWYAPGTTVDPLGASVSASRWWTNYVSPGYEEGKCGGLRLFGAYVETKFLTCSFQITDFFEKEPVKILASMVDYTGDPCTFEGICVVTECPALMGNGFGEQVLRDIILAQSYLQNYVHSDIRIREITQGNEILDAVDRNALYTRYYILHNVPRFNNPTGVFDNDQYLVEIIVSQTIPALEAVLVELTKAAGNCEDFIVYGCNPCDIIETNPE